MRKLLFNTLLLSLITLFLQGCIFWDYLMDPPAESGNFSLNNMSEDTLTAYIAIGMPSGWGPTVYPDTCLPQSETIWDEGRKEYVNYIEEELYHHAVPPHSCKMIHWLPGDLKRIRYCDTLSVFIISRDTLMKYGYDNVRKDYRVLARYDLDWNEVKALDLIFPYPPTPKMKNMKKWIP